MDPAALCTPFEQARWLDVRPRSALLPGLDARVLLHAGPPYEGALPAAVRQAAVQAILLEGLADDPATAAAMLEAGEFRLQPAQDHGVATPLAQVVSAGMALAVVGDAQRQCYAPLVEGPPPALRFGSMAPESPARMRELASLGLDRLGPGLRRRPVAIAPVVGRALEAGDECHARTGVDNDALLAAMQWLPRSDLAVIAASPGFVLPVLMAAALWCLGGQAHGIAAVGGNGLRFGWRLHGHADWVSVPATPPVGLRLPGHAQTVALGAIGDSAVIDFCGLGGQAIALSPSLRDDWRAVLPPGLEHLRSAVIDPASGLVDPARLRPGGPMPLVNLAILDLDGASGLIGRGVYRVDASLAG